MEKLLFDDVANLCDAILEVNDLYEGNEDFYGVSIVGHYDIIAEVLNYLLKTTSLEMYDISLCPSEVNGYYDEYILSIDLEGMLWCEEAKHGDRYLQTEKEVIFVHSDVNSKFVIANKDQAMIEFDFEDSCDCDCDCENCLYSEIDDSDFDFAERLDIDDDLHGFTFATSNGDSYHSISYHSTEKIDDINIVKELIELFNT